MFWAANIKLTSCGKNTERGVTTCVQLSPAKKKKNHKNKLDGQNSKSYKLKMRTKTFLNNNTYPSSFAFSTCSCPFPNNVLLQNSVSVQKRLAIAGITFCFKKRNSCYYASKPHFLQFQAPLPKETLYYNILQKSAVLNVWCKSSQFSVLLNRSNNPFQDFQISFQITQFQAEDSVSYAILHRKNK